jgi:hypothetical protein
VTEYIPRGAPYSIERERGRLDTAPVTHLSVHESKTARFVSQVLAGIMEMR